MRSVQLVDTDKTALKSDTIFEVRLLYGTLLNLFGYSFLRALEVLSVLLLWNKNFLLFRSNLMSFYYSLFHFLDLL